MYVIGTEQIVAYLIKLPQMLTWQNNTAEKKHQIPPKKTARGTNHGGHPVFNLRTEAIGRMPPTVTVTFESLTISIVSNLQSSIVGHEFR